MKTDSIPVIDISPLLKAPQTVDPALFKKAVQEMHHALHGTGFLYIKNHGIPDALQTKILNAASTFFAEPLDRKMKISMTKGGLAWRGYFPVGGELTSGRPDQKEGIYFGRELNQEHASVKSKTPLHGPNQWPDGPQYAEFKPAVLSYIERMTALGQALMEGVASGLGLERNYFRSRFTDEPTTLFRIFNYPRHVWKNEEDEWGVREHTDMGFLTILRQDENGGLQAKARNGEWIEAPPIDGTFVVNIGDMLEVWTQGIYRATPHRVRNRGAGNRLSLPFFFDPNWTSTLEPINPSLLTHHLSATPASENRKRWDGLQLNELSREMTYGNFVWAKVKRVFPELASDPFTSD